MYKILTNSDIIKQRNKIQYNFFSISINCTKILQKRHTSQ